MVNRKPRAPQLQRTVSRPAPLGGLNVRDPLNAMPPTDSVVMRNWIPYAYGPKVRKGWREWATNMAGNPVRTVLVYYGGTTTPLAGPTPSAPTAVTGQMFACTDANIFNITNATNAPASVRALSSAANAGHISQAMFTNTAGSYLLCASETDGYFYYDGTTWTTPVFGGTLSASNVAFVFPFKSRLWFVERNTSNLWYLPNEQITGTPVRFPVGPFLKHGGPISMLANWTIDAGTGIDDMLVILSERGDILVYKGTDPSSSAAWSLVGSWYLGEVPKGRRSMIQYGGDVLVLTNQGLYPISYVTRGGAAMLQASESDYTSKIQDLISSELTNSFNIYGWGMELFARDGLLLICEPDNGATTTRQFVMATTKNNWCLFDAIPVQCMAQSSGYLFAGTPNGRVIIMQDGFYDAVPFGGSTGNGITGEIQPAFDYFDAPGRQKIAHMVRPTFLSVDAPGVVVQINTDFAFTTPASTPAFPAPTGSTWNNANWDAARWAGALQTFQQWLGVTGVGFALSANFKTVTAGDTQLASIDYMIEDGGPL